MHEVLVNAPPQGVFFLGSEVSGIFKVHVNEPTRNFYKKIQVTLVGQAQVSFTTSQNSAPSTSKEEFIKLSTIVWMKEQVPTQELHTGMNSFPFRIQLPANGLPPSFDGSVGWIRYYVEGRIGGTDNRNHRVKATLITVVENMDMNASQLQTPLCAEKQKTLCCLLCASAPITLNVELPCHGFCIGDIIPLKVTLENGSSRYLRLRAQLLQVVVYTAQGHHRRLQIVLSSSESSLLQPRTNSTWNPEELAIPGHIKPTLRFCGIISIEYVLKVSAIVPWGLNLTVDVTVTIGTVPLHSSTSAPNPVPMILEPQSVPSQPTSSVYPTQGIYPPSHQPPKFGPPNPGSSTVKMGDFQSAPPPSYEDVVAYPNKFSYLS